jgi:hypothetical protein
MKTVFKVWNITETYVRYSGVIVSLNLKIITLYSTPESKKRFYIILKSFCKLRDVSTKRSLITESFSCVNNFQILAHFKILLSGCKIL